MICEAKIKDLPLVEPFAPDVDCPVDRAKVLMEVCAKHSCGHCVLCREGTLQVYAVLEDITSGKGLDGDIELINELCGVIERAAGCEQARETAKQCVRLAEEYAEQFEQHSSRKRCQNLVCKQLYTLHVAPGGCKGCGECAAVCLKNAIAGGAGMIHVIHNDACDRCLLCMEKCPANAIQKAGAVKPKGLAEPVPVGAYEENAGGRRRRRG